MLISIEIWVQNLPVVECKYSNNDFISTTDNILIHISGNRWRCPLSRSSQVPSPPSKFCHLEVWLRRHKLEAVWPLACDLTLIKALNAYRKVPKPRVNLPLASTAWKHKVGWSPFFAHAETFDRCYGDDKERAIKALIRS